MQTITSRLSNAARARVQARLRARPKLPFSGALEGKGSTGAATASELAQSLAELISVDLEHLRREDTFRDIFRVRRDELPVEVQPLLQKVGLHDVVDPFGMALLDFVEKRISEDRSRMKRAPFARAPSNEDEWLERILDTTVGELLVALA